MYQDQQTISLLGRPQKQRMTLTDSSKFAALKPVGAICDKITLAAFDRLGNKSAHWHQCIPQPFHKTDKNVRKKKNKKKNFLVLQAKEPKCRLLLWSYFYRRRLKYDEAEQVVLGLFSAKQDEFRAGLLCSRLVGRDSNLENQPVISPQTDQQSVEPLQIKAIAWAHSSFRLCLFSRSLLKWKSDDFIYFHLFFESRMSGSIFNGFFLFFFPLSASRVVLAPGGGAAFVGLTLPSTFFPLFFFFFRFLASAAAFVPSAMCFFFFFLFRLRD